MQVGKCNVGKVCISLLGEGTHSTRAETRATAKGGSTKKYGGGGGAWCKQVR